ncbi:hypothetical protein FE257_010279 [Aspergillus nanangensis]|uniref:Carrier domain-containing protein n=1 Tax=Aspergillus nanangensis TaxID=2582783 RepID=A0AAD4CIZ1_ASPNN|nr:hypothetical protein FE257_010279 [Aspergillus nanangensis]
MNWKNQESIFPSSTTQAESEHGTRYGIASHEIEETGPCTPEQLAYGSSLSQGDNRSIAEWDFEIPPDINIDSLKKAWQATVRSHSLLRTRIVANTSSSAFLRVVLKGNLRPQPERDHLEDEPWTLGSSLARFRIQTAGTTTHGRRLLIQIHHAICDPCAVGSIFQFLDQVYHNEVGCQLVAIPSGGGDTTAFPELPPSLHRPIARHHLQQSMPFRTSGRSFNDISSLLWLAWAVTQSQYQNSDDVLFGTARRGHGGAPAHVVSRRFLFDGQATVGEFLQDLESGKCTQHVHALGPDENDLASAVQTIVSVLPHVSSHSLEFARLSDSRKQNPFSNYALTLDCRLESDSSLTIHVHYDHDVLPRWATQRVLNHFVHVMSQLSDEDHGKPLARFKSLGPQDRAQLAFWNGKNVPVMNELVHDVIRTRSTEQPREEAICSWDGKFTYSELDRLSDSVAAQLADLNLLSSGSVVPIYINKSRWVPIAILGVLKAGAAFTLFDPSYPLQRLRTMAQDVKADLIICSKTTAELANQIIPRAALQIDDHKTYGSLYTSPSSSQSSLARPQDPLYVAFTSGSTGKPKATVIEHRAYCTGAREHIKAFRLTRRSRVLQFAMYAFDVSIMEILSTLMAGGCLCILNETQRTTPQAFTDAFSAFDITHALLTPSFARTLRHEQLPSLNVLILGGEPMSSADVDYWTSRRVQLMNAYGPAECSVNSAVQPDASSSHSSNIGFPTGAACWVVDPKDHHQLVPIGAIGELLVQGPIVGGGYLNNPELTQASFVEFVPPIPGLLLSGDQAVAYRAYKTGDLVRQQEDGSMVYIGRKDQQVKIRGQRIELSEVEFHIQKSLGSPGDVVIETAIPQGKSQPVLVAFLLHRKTRATPIHGCLVPPPELDEAWLGDIDAIEASLRQTLPTAMIPTLFLPLAEVPTTGTGKINRRLLRELVGDFSLTQLESYRTRNNDGTKRQPSTAAEHTLQELYSGVLEVPLATIGVEDNFFRLGGDSILAIRLVGAARDAGLALTVAQIFSTPTISGLSLVSSPLSRQEEILVPPFSLLGDTEEEHMNIIQLVRNQCEPSHPDSIEDIYPCTALQEGMYALSLKSPGAYTGRVTLELPGAVDIGRFLSAWRTVVDANPILRTQIVQTSKGLFQVVTQQADLDCGTYTSIDEIHQSDEASRNPLCWVALVNSPGQTVLFALTIHHALCDGWSLGSILNQLDAAYMGASMPSTTNFNTFIKYLHDLDGWEAYWTSELGHLQAPIFPPLPSPSYIPSPTSLQERRIHELRSVNSEIRLPVLIQMAWVILVSQYTDSADVVIGLTLNGRNAPVSGIEELTGPTITTVPLRMRVDDETTVSTALTGLQDQLAAMIPYEQAGLQRIGRLNEDCKTACSFQTQLAIQPPSDDPSDDGRCFDVSNGSAGSSMDYSAFSTYAMVVVCELGQSGTDILLKLHHDPDVITADEAECMINLFEHLLRQLCETPDRKLGQLQLAGPRDREQFAKWNTTVPAPVERCLHSLILDHGRTQPKSSAISGWDGHLTYEELGLLSIRLSRHLRTTFAIGSGDIVPICPDRSKWAIVSILAVMYAGAACVLLDLRHPRARMQGIVGDTAAKTIICSPGTHEKVKGLTRNLVIVNSVMMDSLPALGSIPECDKANEPSPKDPAFIIFTSGSTGKPKGIIMSHQSLNTSVHSYSPELRVDRQTRMLHFSSYAFDASIYEIFTALLGGGCLCVPSASDCASNLAGFIRQMGVSLAILAPSVVRVLHPDDVPSLRTLALGGEALTWELVNLWANRVRLVNAYGPAEATIMAAGVVRPGEWTTGVIGQVVGANPWITKPFNPDRLVARGMIGELLVEGPVLADGYLNAPEKTTASFIPAPAWLQSIRPNSPADNTRLYRSGDLVQQQRDGSIRFMGRRDNQVKLRGQRIELQEVEHCVTSYLPDRMVIAEVASFHTSGRRRDELVIFIREEEVDEEDQQSALFVPPSKINHSLTAGLKAHMASKLPPFMVPWVILFLHELPMTASGKTDRRRLRLEAGNLDQRTLEGYLNTTELVKRPPTTAQEILVRNIFARVLSLPESSIGVDDSFFHIGGDSISAMQVLTLCRRASLHLTMPDFLIHNTVALFCINTCPSTADKTHIDTHDETDGPFPLSPIQRLVLGSSGLASKRFNQSFFLKIQRRFDPEEIRSALSQIVQHHSMLRVRWVQPGGKEEAQQIISSSTSFCVREHQIHSKEQIDSLAKQAHACLDVQHGPIISLDIFSVEGGADYALFIAPNLAVDLVSWRIILGDIEDLLKGKQLGDVRPFPFQAWVRLQQNHAQKYTPKDVLSAEVHEVSHAYWGLRPEQNVFGSAIELGFTLTPETTDILLGGANMPLSSQPQEIFQAALLHAWQKVFEDRSMPTIFVEGHGRDPSGPEIDLSRTVGWFTTMFPSAACSGMGRKLSLQDILRRVKDTNRRVPGNGLPYFSSRAYNAQCEKAFKHHLPADIIFNYAGDYRQFEQPDAVFSQTDWILDQRMDVAEDMPRLALFDVAINIRNAQLYCSIRFCKDSQRQDLINRWVREYQHSLRTAAAELVTRPHQLTMCDVPLLEVNNYDGLSALENCILNELALESPSTIERIYPCSDSQAGVLEALSSGTGCNKARTIFKISGGKAVVDPARVLACWRRLIQRHAILRTVMIKNPLDSRGYLHVVLKQAAIDAVLLSCPSASVVADLCDVRPTSDWDTSPAHHMAIGQAAPGEEVFFKLETGNAMIDAFSLSVLIDELCLALDDRLPLQRAPAYEDFVAYVQSQPLEEARGYWSNALDDDSGGRSSLFPRLLPNDAQSSSAPILCSNHIILDNFKDIDRFWRQNRLTFTNILQVAWGIILSAYTRSSEVCFGALVSGRDIPVANIEKIVGPCFNVLPCRLRLAPGCTIMDVLRENQHEMQRRSDYQHCSISEMVGRTAVQATDRPLFNTCLSVQPSFSAQTAGSDCAQGHIVEIHDPTEYDVCLAVLLSPSQIEIEMRWWSFMLSEQDAMRLLGDLNRVVSHIVTHSALSIASFEL